MALDYTGLTKKEIAAEQAAMTARAKEASDEKIGFVPAGFVQTKEGVVEVNSKGQARNGSIPISINTPEPKIPAAGGDGAGGQSATGGDSKFVSSSEMQDAYQLLYNEFNALGLGSLVESAKSILMGAPRVSDMPSLLRETPEYKQRFKANDDRIKAGLRAISPAEYIKLEDQYQEVMRNYGLPATYYTPGVAGRQEGFEKFISGDVSSTELEDRIIAAQERVLKSNPEVIKALKQFYPGITNGDILAYSLDPKNALKDIQRKVSAAEIGGAALAQGLNAGVTTAEELAGYGVTKAQAQQGFQTVAEMAPRGSQLAEFYKETPYDQATATAEVFGTAGAAEATKKRKKLTALEQAQFGGSSGVGALGRDRVAYQSQTFGSGQY